MSLKRYLLGTVPVYPMPLADLRDVRFTFGAA